MIKKILVLYFYLKAKYFLNFHSSNDIAKWQDKMIHKFLKRILKKSKYYNQKFTGIPLDNWKTLPITDKKDLMENFDEINTVGIKREEAYNLAHQSEKERCFTKKYKNITVGLSSGTSGNHGIFLASDIERYLWAGYALAKILPYSIFKKHKIAFFLRANSNLYETVKSRNIIFKYFDMLNSMDENLKEIREFKPTLLIAPPSILKIIARNYSYINISPVKIISVAEVLEELDKNYLEKIFGQKVHQIYQATEGFIATTCKHGHLHINEDMIAIQKEHIDKEHRKFVPIITDFNRTSQPIIRYRLNDILTEAKEPCPCGSKYMRIEKIEGRCDDIFYLKSTNDNNDIAIFPDFISRAVIFASQDIQEYKVIQHTRDEILVYINNFYEFDKYKKSGYLIPKVIQ